MLAKVENLFNKVSTLPEDLQDNLVFFWNEDIENELDFDKKLYNTSDKLIKLAQNALLEFKQNKTIQKGFDEL